MNAKNPYLEDGESETEMLLHRAWNEGRDAALAEAEALSNLLRQARQLEIGVTIKQSGKPYEIGHQVTLSPYGAPAVTHAGDGGIAFLLAQALAKAQDSGQQG